MLSRILMVAALGLAVGVVAAASLEQADACTCIFKESWAFEVVEASPGADPRWQGRFSIDREMIYALDDDDWRTDLVIYMQRLP